MSHRFPLHRQMLGGLTALLAIAAAPSAASADAWSFPTVGARPAAACTNPVTSQPFAKFNDRADYALAPGGNFESGATGWVFENAKLVDGNESAGVSPGRKSVLLGVSRYGGAASVTSPEFCVTQDHPTFRAVVRSPGSWGKSGYGSNIVYRTMDALGTSYMDLVGIQSASSGWRPTEINPLATAIPVEKFSAGVLVKVKFYLPSYNVRDGGQIQIDNLMIDPYRRS